MLVLNVILAIAFTGAHSTSFIDQITATMKRDPARAESLIRQKFSPADLTVGISPYKEGVNVLFAVDAGKGRHQVSVSGDNLRPVKFFPVGDIYVGVAQFEPEQGTTAYYSIDEKKSPKIFNIETYKPNPLVDGPPGGRKGELRDMGEWKSTIFAGTTRKWFIYLPPNFDPNQLYPVLIGTDAQWDRQWQANALENCAREKLIPPTVGVFIEPGQDKPGNYSFRSHEYDRLSGDYSSFLLSEILPQVEKIIKLSQDPSQRACVGVSSGGICGFTSCWQHPESFSAVISGVGSFDDIAHGESLKEGGHNYPFMVRLSDKKPIRAFLQDGDHDIDNEFGNWFLGNEQMAKALKFKGYDINWNPGHGFHSSDHLRSIFDKALVWWNGMR